MYENFSNVHRVSQPGARLYTKRHGVEARGDSSGNRYFRSSMSGKNGQEHRWIIVAGETEATKIPSSWLIRLHRIADVPLSVESISCHSMHMACQRGPACPGSLPLAPENEYQAWHPRE